MKETESVLLLVLAFCGFDSNLCSGRNRHYAVVFIDKSEGVSVIGANVIEYDKENRVVNGTVCDVNGDFVLNNEERSNNVSRWL